MGWKDTITKAPSPSWKDTIQPEEKDYLAETAMMPEFLEPGIPSLESIAAGANVTDVLSSAARSGISEAVRGYEPTLVPTTIEELTAGPKALARGGKAAAQQLIKNIQSPLSAPAQAPSLMEVSERELRSRTAPNILLGEKEKKVAAGISGLGAELAMPAFEFGAVAQIPKAKKTLESWLSGSKEALKSVERNQLQKVIQKNIKASEITNQGFVPEDISSQLVAENLSKYANNPDKMLEALEGKATKKRTAVAPGLERTEITSKTPGIIETKSKALKQEISDIADANNVSVEVPQFSFKQKLRDKSSAEDPVSGLRTSPEIIEQRNKMIDELLKPYEEEWVPGIPLSSASPRFTENVPPPIPLGQADLFPLANFEKQVNPPTFPTKPEFEGIEIPTLLKAPEDQQLARMVPSPEAIPQKPFDPTYPAPPIPPQEYGGVVSKEAKKAYETQVKEHEKAVAKINKDYTARMREYEDAVSASEKVRKSLASEAIQKYDDVKKAWDLEVEKIQNEYLKELENARGLDKKIMDAKIKQSADRFLEKAKRNKAYREEVIKAEEDYRQYLIEALNKKLFVKPRHWSLKDMLELRTNLGKKLTSPDFFADTTKSLEKDVTQSIYDSLRDEISNSIKGMPTKVKGFDGNMLTADEYYDLQSKALHKLMQAKSVLTTAKIKGMRDPDLLAKAVGATTGASIFGATTLANLMTGGNINFPATALGIGAAASGYGAMKAMTPGMAAKGASALRAGIEIAEQYPEATKRILSVGARQLRDNYVMEEKPQFPKVYGRTPQSVDITKVKIPRTMQGILENKELVLEKLASSGVSEKMYLAIAHGLNNNKKDLASTIPLLMQEMPGIFEDSDYNLFDGKFIDINEAAATADSISKREDLSSIEKAKIINEINKNKRWIGGL